jgi:hypothetical protein
MARTRWRTTRRLCVVARHRVHPDRGLWHIALREWSREIGEEPDQTIYKFSDAPPWMCLEAAGKIPELIQTLIDRTREMRARIATKKNELDELGALLAELANNACDDGR